jgi:ferredoxin-NADP reductase
VNDKTNTLKLVTTPFSIAKIGDKIQALYPCGDFNVTLNGAKATNYLMIAGGSGITPLYSMIRSILATERDSHITLLYANESKKSIIFHQEINKLSSVHANFEVIHFISGQKQYFPQSYEFRAYRPSWCLLHQFLNLAKVLLSKSISTGLRTNKAAI